MVLLLCSFTSALAGLKWIDIGVNGLTCSMCSRSVEMSVRRLDFVDNVVMSLETTEARIYFKQDLPVNLDQLAKAVVNAGFSVRFLKLNFDFTDIPVNKDGQFTYQGQKYKWVDFGENIAGEVNLKVMDENFLPKKESTEWKKKYPAKKTSGNERVLHVVLHG